MSGLPCCHPDEQVYSSYARSHLYYAAELLLLVILLLLVETTVRRGGAEPVWVALRWLRHEQGGWAGLDLASKGAGWGQSTGARPVARPGEGCSAWLCSWVGSRSTVCHPLPSRVQCLIWLQSYAGISWSTWMVSISILWAPFWFNPQTFQVGAGSGGISRWQEAAAHNGMWRRGGAAEAHSHSPLGAADASKRLARAWAPAPGI